MKLRVFTLALDAMPFITWHLPTFNRLNLDWHWYIAEGAAMNTHCTAWCKQQQPRLSRDGTTEYLHSIREHPRVTLLQRQSWDGKVEMCNACLEKIKDPCVLLQMDADEVWQHWQLERLANMREQYPHIVTARFYCRYFVGPNIVITSTNGYGNRPSEWVRAWNFKPGMKFTKHEPPIMEGATAPVMNRDETKAAGLMFDHYAYAFEKQVAYKGQFYGYPNAVAHWRRLQAVKFFPVRDLKQYLPWVGPGVAADKLFK